MNSQEQHVEDGGYLIAVKDFVVAQDIASTIRDLYPQADVLSVQSLDEAEKLIPAFRSISFAILDVKPPALGASRIGGILAESRASILFLGEAPEQGSPVVARTIRFLPKPFSTAGLVEALESIQWVGRIPRAV
jgi:hypothetical protein